MYALTQINSFFDPSIKVDVTNDNKELINIINKVSIDCFQKGHLFLFDARGRNNQCHLGALMITNAYTRFKKDGKLDESDQRLIQVSFMLSTLFRHVSKELLASFFTEKEIKGMEKLLQDRKINQACTLQFALEIKNFISTQLKLSPHQELIRINQEPNLHETPKSTLYCYPKFAGVFFMEDKVHTPLVLKIKVLCPKGKHLECYVAPTIKDPFLPAKKCDLPPSGAIVIEGFANRQGLPSFDVYMQQRTKCTQNFFAEKFNAEKCSLCTDCPGKCEEIDTYRSEFTKRALNGAEILKMASADFTNSLQTDFVKRFFTNSTYPELSKLFKECLEAANRYGVTADHATLLGIEHVYPDELHHAINSSRLLDQSPALLAKECQS